MAGSRTTRRVGGRERQRASERECEREKEEGGGGGQRPRGGPAAKSGRAPGTFEVTPRASRTAATPCTCKVYEYV